MSGGTLIEFGGKVDKILTKAKALLKDRFKPKAYGIGRDLYIASSDGAMLFHYQTDDCGFAESFAFNVPDYDGRRMRKDAGGRLFFETVKKGYIQRKHAASSVMSPEQARTLFDAHPTKDVPCDVIYLDDPRDALKVELRFVELGVKDGVFRMVQRDYLDDVSIELQKEASSGDLLDPARYADFGPVGVGVDEFLFPFALTDKLTLNVPKTKSGVFDYCWMESLDAKMPFTCLLACRFELKDSNQPKTKGKRK